MVDYPLASSESELNIGVHRYSSRVFPPYRYVPGLHPHPTNSPDGHSYGLEDEEHEKWNSESWSKNEDYLNIIIRPKDNHNYAFLANKIHEITSKYKIGLSFTSSGLNNLHRTFNL